MIEIYGHTPSPEAEIPSSVTNSPPNSDQRFSEIENKLQTIFESDEPDLPKVQKHISRAVHGGKQAIQDLALARQTIRKMQSHKIPIKKTKRIVKGASKSPLSSIAGNSRVQRRYTKETKKELRDESANARIRDYWRRANEALKEKEEAVGGTDYIGNDDYLIRFVNTDGMVDEKYV